MEQQLKTAAYGAAATVGGSASISFSEARNSVTATVVFSPTTPAGAVAQLVAAVHGVAPAALIDAPPGPRTLIVLQATAPAGAARAWSTSLARLAHQALPTATLSVTPGQGAPSVTLRYDGAGVTDATRLDLARDAVAEQAGVPTQLVTAHQ